MKHSVGCTGKQRYNCFNEADKTAKRVRQQRDAAKVAPYHCKRCGGFHVGSSDLEQTNADYKASKQSQRLTSDAVSREETEEVTPGTFRVQMA